MSQDLPVQDAPLLLDTKLNEMLSRYLEDKPYKMVKPIVEAIQPMERKAPGSDEMQTVYTLPRTTAVHLLNQVMGNEEMVRVYMFIRQGYEQAIAADREAAAKVAAEQKRKPQGKSAGASTASKEKKIKEVDVEDNISPKIEEVKEEPPTEKKDPPTEKKGGQTDNA